MNLKNNIQGFSLLELLLAISLSAGILASLAILFQPVLREVASTFDFDDNRAQVSGQLQALDFDLSQARAVYVDSGQCYELCFIDSTGENRVVYYWSGNDLYRRSHDTDENLACTAGNLVLRDLEVANTSFSLSGDRLDAELYSVGTTDSANTFRVITSIFPKRAERETLFYEGFECNTDTSRGWSYTTDNGTEINWAIENHADAVGSYRLRLTLASNQASPLSASADLPLSLRVARSSNIHLRFQVMNNNTMNSNETLIAEYFDGSSWTEVYRENNAREIATWETVVVDLSSFSVNENSRIRFTGELRRSIHEWMIDEIELFTR